MNASFFKGLSWLIFLNLLVKPVWIFFIDREVQNRVGFEVYGKFFAILNLSLVLFAFADAGLSILLNQRIASKTPVNVFQFLRLKIFLILTYILACTLFAWMAHVTNWELLFYVVLIQVLTSMFIFFRSIITAHQFFSMDAWLSIADKMLLIFICGTFLYIILSPPISMQIFLQMQVFSLVIAVLLALIFIVKERLLLYDKTEKIAVIWKSIWPLASILLLMAIHYRLDGFLLERIHLKGSYEAGMYAAAYRLLDAGNMIGYLAASFLLPFIARNHNNKLLVGDVIIKTRHGLIVFAIGVVTFSFVFASWIRLLLYADSQPYLSTVIATCMASLPAYFIVHIYGSILTATSRLNIFLRILLLTVLINIVLNVLLIPAYGAFGCCIAALVSQYFSALLICTIATKKLEIQFDYRSGLIYFLLAVFLIGFFYMGEMLILNVWIILAIAIVICMLILCFLLGIFKKQFILPR